MHEITRALDRAGHPRAAKSEKALADASTFSGFQCLTPESTAGKFLIEYVESGKRRTKGNCATEQFARKLGSTRTKRGILEYAVTPLGEVELLVASLPRLLPERFDHAWRW
jgi:hypothetical protein